MIICRFNIMYNRNILKYLNVKNFMLQKLNLNTERYKVQEERKVSTATTT